MIGSRGDKRLWIYVIANRGHKKMCSSSLSMYGRSSLSCRHVIVRAGFQGSLIYSALNVIVFVDNYHPDNYNNNKNE